MRVPDANVLGEVDGGWGVAMTTLVNERAFIGGNVRRFSPADLAQLARDHGRIDDHVLRDWKYSIPIEALVVRAMQVYGETCGWALARAHACSGDRIAIAAYLGGSDVFDKAIAEFAAAYADQNERDHKSLLDAVATGRLTAERDM